MSSEHLKLTTYFGERDRTEAGLLADELLAIYGSRRIATSVLLRGTEGFGRLHHLHTDRLLTLSEDLPIVSIAVDRRERIEALLQQVLQIKRRGLITLERADLISGSPGTLRLAPEPPWTPRPPHGLESESKLTVYLGRHERVGRLPGYVAVTQLLHECGIAGASVLLGVDGTRNGERFRGRFLSRNAEVPAMVIAVGSSTGIASALPEINRAVRQPLVTLERVQVCKRDGVLLSTPQQLPETDERGLPLWQQLTVYSSQSATVEGHPLSSQIVRRLRESQAAGATSLRGVWGFHGERAPHGDRFLQLQRHVPVLTIAVDAPEKIARSFAIVDELTRNEGLVTSEIVPAMQAISAGRRVGGTSLAEHSW